jgi:sulfate transport system substrate-binding protein
MKTSRSLSFNLLLPLAVIVALSGCARRKEAAPQPAADTLVLAAYTVPKEAYTGEIIPAFREHWRRKTGREVDVQQSYEASGAQARAVAGGFEADVVALSLEGDVDKITDAGLITHDWRARPWGGFITRSLVVIATRPGNPKNIRDWSDLTRSDVEVLYPNPKTSGGAMWGVNAIYGAGLKLSEAETGTPDPAVARDLLKRIQARVKVMDKSGRESVTTFERGIGDALITYENEVLLRNMQGRPLPFVIPRATILIENPVAVVDKYADQHGARAVAEEFVLFLHGEAAQRAFARYGFRPASPEIMREVADRFPVAPLQFDIGALGGWTQVREMLYGPQGVWTQVTQELGQNR